MRTWMQFATREVWPVEAKLQIEELQCCSRTYGTLCAWVFGSQVHLQMLQCLPAAAQPAGSTGPELQPAALVALEQFMSLPMQKGAVSALSKGEACLQALWARAKHLSSNALQSCLLILNLLKTCIGIVPLICVVLFLSPCSGEDFLDHQVHVWQLWQHLPGKWIPLVVFSKASSLQAESIGLQWRIVHRPLS